MCYFIFVFKHHNVFNNERTMNYILAAVLFSFVSSFIGSLGTVVYNSDFLICSMYPANFWTATIEIKLTIIFRFSSEVLIFVLTFLLQSFTFIWCWKVAKTDKTLNKDGQVWKRMIRNFISLFSVTLVIASGAFFMRLSHSLGFALLKRISALLYIFGSPFLNPLIILTGNPPLRNAFIKRKKGVITNYGTTLRTITQSLDNKTAT